MKGHIVKVEANVRSDKESCVIVGLPDASMKESKERILSCLHALDLDMTMKKITIHLSPSDKRKTGTGYDGAMLLAVLREMIEEPIPIDDKMCVLASLSLDGRLVPFHGLVPVIQQAVLLGFERIILPPVDVRFLGGTLTAELVPLSDVKQLLGYLRGQLALEMDTPQRLVEEEDMTELVSATDFSKVRGHRDVKRVLEIAAAGGHHVLMSGPPGCGKSMLADAFHTIVPDLPNEEMLEVYSVYHLAKETRGFSVRPPYRSPHHSASAISLVGGGTYPKPGEISLAHRGVLFLDELGEFSRKTLDMLRQPMETGEVTISRVRQSVTYPSSFILIGATNPCPCGYFGSNERYCTCTSQQVRAYQLKASGPLLDRLDFVLTLKSVGLTKESAAETSVEIRFRTKKAQELQRTRYKSVGLNGNVPGALLLATSGLTVAQTRSLQEVCYKEKWSNRTQVKLIRIARTIADLEGTEAISENAIQEAVHWKRLASLHQEEQRSQG
ncbi:YifB family Mg chelatase-like AAA ATPase [Sporosarcina sp. A2]|uniref:YifB family Mg chelatase-like AAA ATPase n=1 Tax=Sporosarcina sp. A2 TaxID=3393449 RepID=UPI003D78DC14